MAAVEDNAPELILFRTHPAGWLERPPLPGALQAFETSLLAIALSRYHTALVLCVSAIEAAIKAHLGLPLPTAENPNVADRYLPSLWNELAMHHPKVAAFSKAQVEQLKNKRNRMAHYGHAPADNPACAELLLDVGYPLFTAVLADCFDFHLDWCALHPEAHDLLALPEDQRERCGLLPHVAAHWRRAFELRRLTRGTAVTAPQCFIGLSHFMRRYIGPTFVSDAESAVQDRGWDVSFDFRQKRLSQIETKFTNYWVTDCPYCDEVQCLALDLDFPVRGFEVRVSRAICASCDLVVPDVAPLATVLFADELAADRSKIIKEYSLKE